MKKVNLMIVLGVIFLLQFSIGAFAEEYRTWDSVVESNTPVSIYVEDIPNETQDKTVDAEKVTEIVKKLFTDRIEPDFNVVAKPDKADIIFKAKISDYIWSKTAPLTNITGAGAIIADELTRRGKQWAKIELDYRIYDAQTNRLLLDYDTQVTLKQKDMPEDDSYGLIYERLPKILAMDLFKRYKRKR